MKSIYKILYNKCIALYTKWGEKNIPHVYALCFISLIQMLNLFTIVIVAILFKLISPGFVGTNRFYGVLFFMVAYLVNWVWLKPNSKYGISQDSKRIKIYANVYLFSSFFSFLILLIYYVNS